MKPLHIGKIIEEYTIKNGIRNYSEIARKLKMTPSNFYTILKRETIDTGLLGKINKALGFNFFVYFVDENGKAPITDNQLKKELDQAKKEIEYLKEINSLLRKK